MKIFWLVVPLAYVLEILFLIIIIAKKGKFHASPLFLNSESFACLIVSFVSIFCIYMFMR